MNSAMPGAFKDGDADDDYYDHVDDDLEGALLSTQRLQGA